jgi:chorismate mutase
VRSGIPAVVAMQYEITDRAAIEFSRSFYDAVADRLPIDAAVAEARTAVKMGSALEWGTPVLYMRSEDGLIFDIPSEGRHTELTEATEEVEDQERLLRRYRERVESAWTSGELDSRQAEQLKALANELELNSSAAADIEREVMSATIEEILERREQAAREERRNYLDELYGRARGLHRDQEWQTVVGVFAQIHAEDPTYPDPEGLLQSAREALEIARKEQDTIRRYREAVEWAWADEDLNGRDVKRLTDLVNRLELSPNTAAQIEREVMGETKEAILDRQEQASAEQYRKALEEAWTDNELSNTEAKRLSTLASELGLSTDTAAEFERDIIGDTIPAILQRHRRLDELYAQARQLHQDQEWQMVVDNFERIHSEDPAFRDPEGLLASAREALDRMRKVAALYDQALRYVDGSEWQQALKRFEEVQRLEPGYQETEELLSRVRRELTPPPMAKVPDLSGQEVSQASSALTSKGLRLGNQREAPSDTVPEGQIIGQSPEAGREVQTDTSVSVTISSGPSTVAIPDLTGKSRDEEGSTEVPQAVSLSLGDQAFFDELSRVCAKYTGLGYYVNEAMPGQNLADARASIPIPTGERVIALVDNSSILARGIGLAVCGDGIRWRNYAENPVSKTMRGFLEWPEFADVPLREYQWAAEYGIEMGRDNVFVAWKDNAMDQHRLVKLLQDIQSLVKTSISH